MSDRDERGTSERPSSPSGAVTGEWAEADPFELPEWLGLEEVTWRPDAGLGSGLVPGWVSGDTSGQGLTCDLLAADLAHPAPVLPEGLRTEVHRTWVRGEVLLVRRGERLTVAAPGTEPSADQVLEMLRRFAKAVGAPPERFAARLYLRR